jgi:hypothetical protein
MAHQMNVTGYSTAVISQSWVPGGRLPVPRRSGLAGRLARLVGQALDGIPKMSLTVTSSATITAIILAQLLNFTSAYTVRRLSDIDNLPQELTSAKVPQASRPISVP